MTQELNADKISIGELRAIRRDFLKGLLINEPMARSVIQTYVKEVLVYEDYVKVSLNSYRNFKH